MNRTRRILLAVSLGAIVIAALCYNFVPVIPFAAASHDGTGAHRLIERSLGGKAEVEAVASVLSQYGERYSITSDSRLLITLRLFLDKELRWNYTSKAGL